MRVFRAPRGRGPYGITTTPNGRGLLRLARGKPHRADRRSHRQGDRHPTADRRPGRTSGVVELEGADLGQRVERRARWPATTLPTKKWREWDVPGPAQPYAVYVDDKDVVWLTDFGAQRAVALRAGDGPLHARAAPRRGERAPAARATGRGVGRRVGRRPARRRAPLSRESPGPGVGGRVEREA